MSEHAIVFLAIRGRPTLYSRRDHLSEYLIAKGPVAFSRGDMKYRSFFFSVLVLRLQELNLKLLILSMSIISSITYYLERSG